jgi:IrrE N-terminal-like domain
LAEGSRIGDFVRENAKRDGLKIDRGVPTFRVTVNDRLEPSERFVTIAHELGHIFCGHLGGCTSRTENEEESGWPSRSALGTNEQEVEAESVAYLLASRAGIVTGSAAYLKKHAEKADMAQIPLTKAEVADVAAYILSLRDADRR